MKNTTEKIMADYDLELFSYAKKEPCFFSLLMAKLTFLVSWVPNLVY